MTPSTSKCCEKCYDPYSTQGYDITSPCGNPDCPCHTTHNQEESLADKCQNELFKEMSNYDGDFNGKLNLQRTILEKYLNSAIQEERERLAGQVEKLNKVGEPEAWFVIREEVLSLIRTNTK